MQETAQVGMMILCAAGFIAALATAAFGSGVPVVEAQSPANTEANIIRVAPSGSDTLGCGSAAMPCRSIAFAVNQAASGDEIRVAAGIYQNTGLDAACSFLIDAVVCVNSKSLTLRGGFSAGNWSSPNPSANPTIIDGQNTYRGINVVRANPLTMEGFIIQNGRAVPDPGDPNAFGGGMSAIESALTLRDMVFRNNQVIGPNTSSDRGGAGAGGALAIRSSPGRISSTLERVIFENNTSLGGTSAGRGGFAFGAVFIYASNVNITHCTFTGNRALAGSDGSGIGGDGLRADALGGAIALEGGTVAVLIGVQVSNNETVGGNGSQYGGGAFGAGLISEDSTLIVADSQFRSNVARGGNGSADGGMAGGGGILALNSNARIERVQVIANRLSSGNASGGTAGAIGGGGLYLWRGRPDAPSLNEVINTIVADNSLEKGQGTSVGGGGGGIQVQGLTANLIHVTLARNWLGPGLVVGQALVVVQAPGVSAATANLSHSIVANHTAETSGATAIVVLQGNTLNMNRVLFAGNTNNLNTNSVPLLPGAINGLNTVINTGSAGFASPGTPNYDYRITTNSPAVDQAIGSGIPHDFEMQSRPNGQAPDLGADELETSEPPQPPSPPPDLSTLTERVYIPIAIR